MAFIGYTDDKEKFNQETDEKSAVIIGEGNSTKLSYDDIGVISDEMLDLLQRTRNRHDPYTVYMQSNPDFYDQTYNRSEDEIKDLNLLNDAKQILRVYKRYSKYAHAVETRNKYMEMLIDKYGGEDRFQLYLNTGLVTDWIPPVPIFSKAAPPHEYELYMNNGMVIHTSEWDDDKLLELANQMAEERGVNYESLGITGGISTRYYIQKIYDPDENRDAPITYSRSNNNTKFDGVSIDDIEALRQKFTNWYKADVKPELTKSNSKREYFKDSPNAIRERYYTGAITDIDNETILALLNGQEIAGDDEDYNAMVTDPITHRPMTVGELKKREFIRFMKDSGWSELRLMNLMNVGSQSERAMLERRRKGKKRAKKKAMSLAESVMGMNEPITDVDDIASFLAFGD